KLHTHKHVAHSNLVSSESTHLFIHAVARSYSAWKRDILVTEKIEKLNGGTYDTHYWPNWLYWKTSRRAPCPAGRATTLPGTRPQARCKHTACRFGRIRAGRYHAARHAGSRRARCGYDRPYRL